MSMAALEVAIESLELIVKARVGAYTRSDGTFVKEHDDNRQSSPPRAVMRRGKKVLKDYHTKDAKALKRSLASALSSGDTETESGGRMTYGDVQHHIHMMRSQLGGDPSHAQHLDHAQYALNQSFGYGMSPVSERHAKLFGAALSGKTRIDDDGMVRHAP